MSNGVTMLDIPRVQNIGELKDYLQKKFNGFESLSHFKMAVNEEYCDDDFVLTENDEVIIIPPVCGG